MSEFLDVMRTEKKYGISKVTAGEIAARLSYVMTPDPHCRNLRPYVVQSVYFDSPYNQDYNDKCSGIESRKKIRLRSYGDHTVFKLEIKQKRGAKQRKQSLLVSPEEADSLLRGDYDFLLRKETALAQSIFSILEEQVYRPKCMVQYNRLAFLEPTNDIRVTIDSCICSSESCFRLGESPIPVYPVQQHSSAVLEVKYNHFLLDYIQTALAPFDLVEVASSKYVSARHFGLGASVL